MVTEADLEQACLIKCIRFGDGLDFWRSFVYSATSKDDEPKWLTRPALRKVPRKYGAWTWRADEKGQYQIYQQGKQPQFDEKVKHGFSKKQSATYINLNACNDKGEKEPFAPPVFHFNEDEPLIGVRFALKSALISRIMMDFGTVYRTYGNMSTKAKAIRDSKYSTVFPSLKAIEESLNKETRTKHNEVLARFKFEKDGTSQVCYFKNDLTSRLVAQLRARDLERRLKMSCRAIPITAYITDAPKKTFVYNDVYQSDDMFAGFNDYSSITNRQLATLIYLQHHDFDLENTLRTINRIKPGNRTLTISHETIVALIPHACRLTYESSHLFFQNILLKNLEYIVPQLKTTLQWKEFFDCIHYSNAKSYFDSIYLHPSFKASRDVMCCGYLASLIDRKSPECLDEIADLCKNKATHLTAANINQKLMPDKPKMAEEDILSFAVASGNTAAARILLENIQELEVSRAQHWAQEYSFNTLDTLLYEYGRRTITAELVTTMNLYDAIWQRKTSKAQQLLRDSKADLNSAPLYCNPMLALAIETEQLGLAAQILDSKTELSQNSITTGLSACATKMSETHLGEKVDDEKQLLPIMQGLLQRLEVASHSIPNVPINDIMTALTILPPDDKAAVPDKQIDNIVCFATHSKIREAVCSSASHWIRNVEMLLVQAFLNPKQQQAALKIADVAFIYLKEETQLKLMQMIGEGPVLTEYIEKLFQARRLSIEIINKICADKAIKLSAEQQQKIKNMHLSYLAYGFDEQNNLVVVEQLLREGAQGNAVLKPNEPSILMSAIEFGNLVIAATIIEAQFQSFSTANLRDATIKVVKNNHPNALKFLCEIFKNKSHLDLPLDELLHTAIKNGNVPMVEMFLQSGADIYAKLNDKTAIDNVLRVGVKTWSIIRSFIKFSTIKPETRKDFFNMAMSAFEFDTALSILNLGIDLDCEVALQADSPLGKIILSNNERLVDAALAKSLKPATIGCAIRFASANKRWPVVAKLIRHPQAQLQSDDINHLLHQIVCERPITQTAMAKQLLDQKADPNYSDVGRKQVLSHAIEAKEFSLAIRMIDHPLEEDTVQQAVFIATSLGHTGIPKQLLTQYPKTNLNRFLNKTHGLSIHLAVKTCNVELVKLFLNHQADIYHKGFAKSALDVAFEIPDRVKKWRMIEAFIERNLLIPKDKRRVLCEAIRDNQIIIAKVLIQNIEAEVDEPTLKSDTNALYVAIATGQDEIATELLKKDLSETTLQQALLIAVKMGKSLVARDILAKRKFDLNQWQFVYVSSSNPAAKEIVSSNDHLGYALDIAASRGDLVLFQILLDHGARIYLINATNRTALDVILAVPDANIKWQLIDCLLTHPKAKVLLSPANLNLLLQQAVIDNKLAMAKKLVAEQVNPFTSGALSLAIEKDAGEFVDFFLEPEYQPADLTNILHFATKAFKEQSVRKLLAKNADPNSTIEGITPLGFLVDDNSSLARPVIEIFLGCGASIYHPITIHDAQTTPYQIALNKLSAWKWINWNAMHAIIRSGQLIQKDKDYLLGRAVVSRKLQVVKDLLRIGAVPDEFAFKYAKCKDIFDALLQSNDISPETLKGALDKAVKMDSARVPVLLEKQAAKYKEILAEDTTIVATAIHRMNQSNLGLLLASGVNIYKPDASGSTAYSKILQLPNQQKWQAISVVAAKAEMYPLKPKDKNQLLMSAWHESHGSMMNHLMRFGANADILKKLLFNSNLRMLNYALTALFCVGFIVALIFFPPLPLLASSLIATILIGGSVWLGCDYLLNKLSNYIQTHTSSIALTIGVIALACIALCVVDAMMGFPMLLSIAIALSFIGAKAMATNLITNKSFDNTKEINSDEMMDGPSPDPMMKNRYACATNSQAQLEQKNESEDATIPMVSDAIPPPFIQPPQESKQQFGLS